MNRATTISEIENMDLSDLAYYGGMWEEHGKREKAELDKIKAKR